jgi:hypothetical protein
MADLTLRLRVDPVTGRREIVIDYTSDSDALPMEHEEQHRQLAEKVVDGGFKNKKVEVSREQEGAATEAPAAEAPSAPTAEPTATKR